MSRSTAIQQMCHIRQCQRVFFAASAFKNTFGTAIHSSLVIGSLNGTESQEVAFGQGGVQTMLPSRNGSLLSHRYTTGNDVELQEVGKTPYSAKQVKICLMASCRFSSDQYNLRSCNCNTFADVALYLTVGKRVRDLKFEKLWMKPLELERKVRNSMVLSCIAGTFVGMEEELVTLEDIEQHIHSHEACNFPPEQ